MAKKLLLAEEIIIGKIHYLRKKKVMLDRDLAALYGVESIRLREQVKRNTDRFPPHFMFQLTEKEVDIMVSQNVIPSKQQLGGSLPYAFRNMEY
jgi:ORF6N domain